MSYRGENLPKQVARMLMYGRMKQIQGAKFATAPHAYLASRINGDRSTLALLGKQPNAMWAVERDRNEWQPLQTELDALPISERYRLFAQDMDDVLYGFGHELLSVFLDFCQHISGEMLGTLDVACQTLGPGSLIGLTCRRAMAKGPRSTVNGATEAIRERLAMNVSSSSIVQRIVYQSKDESSDGSPMMTVLAILGADGFSFEDIDLRRLNERELIAELSSRKLLKPVI